MKNIIFFDFFGVICSEIAPIWFRQYLSDEEAKKIKAEIVSLADIGKLSEYETYEKISQKINIPPEQVAREWESLVKINEELVAIIKIIRKKYPVYLLSNAIDPFLTRILETHDLFGLFDKIYISSQMKIAKPNKEFFQYVLNDLELDPKKIVMIDDNPDNLVGASLCGIDGILFSKNDTFKREFDKFFGVN